MSIRKYKYRQILSALIGSLGVLCVGSTYFWVNPQESYLKSGQSAVNMTEEDFSWFVAVIEVGDLMGTLPSGYLADTIGRKTVMFLAGPLIVCTWILIQLTSSYIAFVIARILQGLAVGFIFTVTPTYLGEVSDRRVRGMAGTLVQAMWNMGMLYQFIVGPQLGYHSGINIVCLAPALVFTVLLSFCPETPRYFLLKKNTEKASEVLAWLHGEPASKSQLESMNESNEEKQGISSGSSAYLKVLLEMFTNRRPLKSLLLVSLIAVTNVIGVTPVLSYSTGTFSKYAGVDPALCTIVMGCLSLGAGLVAAMTVDSIGRRPLLLFSTTSCTIVLLVGGILSVFTTEGMLSSLCLASFPPLMSLGPGTLTYALMAEFFSDRHRGLGGALITMIAAIATFLGLKFFNVIELSLGLHINFFILGGITALSTVVIYKFVPETKGRSFEEIQRIL